MGFPECFAGDEVKLVKYTAAGSADRDPAGAGVQGEVALLKIVSGGQTGVDRAALDVALELGVPCGGWCPKGRLAEDGILPPRYPLSETATASYAERTEWNVRDSDATLILTEGSPAGGTRLTLEIAGVLNRPCRVVDLRDPLPVGSLVAWLRGRNVRVLNIAGPRESGRPGIHDAASAYIRRLLAAIAA